MDKILKLFEKIIVTALMVMMMLAVLAATIEVAVILIKQFAAPPICLFHLDKLLEIFGSILMVIIGIELLETMRAYLRKERVHVEVVFLVALVALARKIIIMDYATVAPAILYGVASVIIALGVGYFLVRHSQVQAQGVQAFNNE